VIVVELLIAFALIAWELLGTSNRAGRAPVAAHEFGGHPVPEPEKAAVTPPAALEAVPETVSRKSRKRGRPPRERQEAEAKVIELLRTAGGKVSKNSSTRKLGKMAGVRKSTMHAALTALLATGVLAKAGGAWVLTGGAS
jgi:hypothetical protein